MKQILLLLFLLLPLTGTAQGLSTQGKKILYGQVGDALLHRDLLGARVELLTRDSVPVDSGVMSANMTMGTLTPVWYLMVGKPGEYILRFSHEGYETKCVPLSLRKWHRRETALLQKPVYLRAKPRERTLGEAEVRATKVKFFHKGDTIVYNADAFQLQEGSMLDELIRQLPGVELKADGRIFVNGKQVESLLLNGERFFDQNRRVMLDNLPNYMVRRVNVYEKADMLGEMLGARTGTERLVMDVELKRQYTQGWIGNVEAAGGTDDRYLARLFGLRFTNQSRLSAYAGINNVNETQQPGEGSEWVPSVGDGLTTTRHGGVDYSVSDRDRRFRLEGSAEVSQSTIDTQRRTSGVNFLSGGDTYDRSAYTDRSRNLSLSTTHTFEFRAPRVQLSLRPWLTYVRTRQTSREAQATFAEEPQLPAITDSLWRPELPASARAALLNRYRGESLYTGHALTAALNGEAYIRMPHSMDMVLLTTQNSLTRNRHERFCTRRYDYGASGSAASDDYRNEYVRTPYGFGSYMAKAEYLFFKPDVWYITPYYQYKRTAIDQDRELMLLHRLDGWGDGSVHALGELPSVTDWERLTLDGANSTYLAQRDDDHTFGLNIRKNAYQEMPLYFQIDLPVTLNRTRLDYLCPAQTDTLLRRSRTFFRPTLKLRYDKAKQAENGYYDTWKTELTYSFSQSAPSLAYAVDATDTSDPLNIRQANAALHDARMHRVGLSMQRYRAVRQRQIYAAVNYAVTQRAIVMGYVYDRATGVRTYRPENIDGNWSVNGNLNFSTPLNRRQNMTLSTATTATWADNVDLVGTDVEQSARRSTVHNLYLTETLSLDYRPDEKYQVGAKVAGTWSRLTSQRADFATVNAADFSYGLTAQVELPWQLQVTTDFTVYSRRGYNDRQMNTDDLVWNARVAKRLLGGRLSLMLDGFDLLGQISNIRRVLNGQGRTETWHNSISRYAMLHAVYRLNVKPRHR